MRVTICSLNFSPQHVAHLVALVDLYRSANCEVRLYVDAAYIEWSDRFETLAVGQEIEAYKDVDLLLVYNIGVRHLSLLRHARAAGTKTAYVLHEPFPGLNGLFKEGRSFSRMLGASLLNALLIRETDVVLLPSEFAKHTYEKYSLFLNHNYYVFPLVFRDEYDSSNTFKRKYFSFIGGFTDPHGRKQFLEFVRFASAVDASLVFQITTSTNLDTYLRQDWMADLVSKERIIVRHGTYLTSEEINRSYRESICVWALYNKATQSGMVVNAMMQGTPVITRNVGSMTDEVSHGVNGIVLSLIHI